MNITKNDKLLESYSNLIYSIQHFQDYSEIDKRTYFITIELDSNYKSHGFGNLKNNIFHKINYLITGSGYNDGPERPALVISDDVEATRINQSISNQPLYPHMHGILVLSKEQNFHFPLIGNLQFHINTAVQELFEVIDCTTQQYIPDKPIHHVVDYACKIRSKQNFYNNNYDYSVLPFEADLHSKKRKSKNSQVSNNADVLFQQTLQNPSMIFSDEYLQKFGSSALPITSKRPISTRYSEAA